MAKCPFVMIDSSKTKMSPKIPAYTSIGAVGGWLELGTQTN